MSDVVEHVKTQLAGQELVIEKLVDVLQDHPQGPEILQKVLSEPEVQTALDHSRQPFPAPPPQEDYSSSEYSDTASEPSEYNEPIYSQDVIREPFFDDDGGDSDTASTASTELTDQEDHQVY